MSVKFSKQLNPHYFAFDAFQKASGQITREDRRTLQELLEKKQKGQPIATAKKAPPSNV